ncbi:MAG: response regulator transcription factor [Tunicatimonas sp.]
MSNSRATILYAEDDLSLGFVTQDNLELAGFRVIHCTGGSEALEKFQQQPIDVCLLDVMLPEMDGFALAREIRLRDAQVPILFLTAKSLKEDRIVGFTLGGDDYVTKPFSIEELILKINVFLRRSQPERTREADTIRIGIYKLNTRQQTLSGPDNKVQRLTYREAQLLAYFARRRNVLLTREAILVHLWQDDDYFAGRSLDVFISRLRKYLVADPALQVENIHGVGFRLVVP